MHDESAFRRPKREVTFTDLGLQPDQIPDRTEESPIVMHFAHLLGTREVWSGDPKPNGHPDEFCGDRELEHDEYCLGCDRCGRELQIRGPGDLPRRRSYRRGRLKGGKG